MKYQTIALTLFVTASLGTSLAHADTVPEKSANFAIQGAGSRPCNLWTSGRQKSGGPTELLLTSWAQGFIDGVTDVLYSAGHTIQTPQLDKMQAFFDDYCRAHPTEMFEGAVRNYGKSLLGKAPDSK